MINESETGNESEIVDECRICNEREDLINACICNGKNKYVHYKCLANLMQTSGIDICELCGNQYKQIDYVKKEKNFLHFLKEKNLAALSFISILLSFVVCFRILTIGMRFHYYPLFETMGKITFKNRESLLIFFDKLMNFQLKIVVPIIGLRFSFDFLDKFWNSYENWKRSHFQIIV
jgi:hypothetical protein